MKKKNYILICIIPLIILCCVSSITILTHRKKAPLKIASYDLPQRVQNAVTSLLNEKYPAQFELVQLDSTLSLEAQKNILKNCSLVLFTENAQTAVYLADNHAKPLDNSLSENFPVSIKEKIFHNDSSLKILPLLYDFCELDLYRPYYDKTGQKTLATWNDLLYTAYLEKSQTDTPLILPFADDADFLDCLGMITEALCGYQTYEKLLSDFSAAKEDKEQLKKTIEAYCAKEQCLNQVITEISGLLKSGIISRAARNFTGDDTFFYMDNGLCGIAFTSLSQHRKLAPKTANNFVSIYIPSKEFTSDRKFSADQISLSLLKKDKLALELAKKLSDDWQESLATLSGLAPVQKNSAVPDHQADDVRFWLAASKGPVLPLSKAIYTQELRSFAAGILRDKVLN